MPPTDPATSFLPPLFNPHKTLRENLKPKPSTYSFLGFEVNSLFGMAACPATGSSDYIKATFANGFDIVTYKTQRSVRFPSNVFPNVLEVELDGPLTPERAEQPVVGFPPTQLDPHNVTIANSCGVNCEGAEFWMADFAEALRAAGPGQVLVLSAQGTIQDGLSEADYHRDFAKTTELGVRAGARVIELNLSCPNVAGEGVLCYSPSAVANITRLVRERVGPDVKLLAKLGYFRANQEELLQSVVAGMGAHIDGITAINTMAAPVVDREGNPAFPGPGRAKSGISGAAVRWAGIEMTSRLRDLRDALGLSYAIIGVGGVMNPKDYRDYKTAGADAVQAATGAMWNPGLAAEIKRYLAAPYIDYRSSVMRGEA
jgi:dihydroorotate dehydrogenase (NAD+) catalytic subunit